MPDEVQIRVLAPFDFDPLVLARCLRADTPWWRPFKRRRLAREIARLGTASSRERKT